MTRNSKPKLTDEEQKFLDLFGTEGVCHIKKLAEALDMSSAGVVELAQKLKDKGVWIWKNGDELCLSDANVDLDPEALEIKDKELKIGVIADTILGSKYEQPTALYNAFQMAEHEGVDVMIHLGVTAGMPTPMKANEFHKLTAQEQIDYVVENYPRSNKFKTRMISGFHDMQWRKGSWKKSGINILAQICAQRDDLIYRGDLYADFPLSRGVSEGARLPVLRAAYHGGDDAPYSKSYPIQGYAENLVQDISALFSDDLPDCAVVGGQGVFLDLPGGAIKHLVSVPGMRLVSPSIMRKKRRSVVPTIGLMILTVHFKDKEFSVQRSHYPLGGIKHDYREKISKDKLVMDSLNNDERAVLKILDNTAQSLGELSRALNRSDSTIKKIIESLRERGFNIIDPEDNPSKHYRLLVGPRSTFNVKPINFEDYFHNTIEVGAVSDTHIGHHSELIEVLNDAYKIFSERKIKAVYHCGDITNGPPKHDEHNKGEIREFRASNLTEDVVSLYPRVPNITTFAICGDHDRWFLDQNGYEILRTVSLLRPDIVNLGVQQGERRDGRVITLLRHFNWGTGYSRSYKPQQVTTDTVLKEVDQELSRYRGKTICVLSGGGHVYCTMLYKGVVFILCPCLQGKTGFITGLGKLSDVGFLIYSVTHNKAGVLTKFTVEYFDRGKEALAIVRKKSRSKGRKRDKALSEILKK